jgi:hypothetical protein
MRDRPPSRQPLREPDPWAAFGYLVSGVGAYGLLGWGLSVWLHASWPIPVGILVGAALGVVLVYYQFVRVADGNTNTTHRTDTKADKPSRDEPDDRGETE